MSVPERPLAQAMAEVGFDDTPLRLYCGQLFRERRRALRAAARTPEEVRAWSQAGVAQRLGTTKATVSAFERGTRWPFLERILLYAFLVNVPPASLFPAQPESSDARRVRRLLAAPPYVLDLIDHILDYQQEVARGQQADVG